LNHTNTFLSFVSFSFANIQKLIFFNKTARAVLVFFSLPQKTSVIEMERKKYNVLWKEVKGNVFINKYIKIYLPDFKHRHVSEVYLG